MEGKSTVQAIKYKTTMSSSCLKSLICKLLEHGNVFWVSQCLLHSHILSQVSAFTVAETKYWA